VGATPLLIDCKFCFNMIVKSVAEIKMLRHLAATAGIFLFALYGNAIANESKSVQLRCVDKNNGFSISVEIRGKELLLDGRNTTATFEPLVIYFIDAKLEKYIHKLDRVTGELTIYNNTTNEVVSIFGCDVVSATKF
jgi:hypothetical protein